MVIPDVLWIYKMSGMELHESAKTLSEELEQCAVLAKTVSYNKFYLVRQRSLSLRKDGQRYGSAKFLLKVLHAAK